MAPTVEFAPFCFVSANGANSSIGDKRAEIGTFLALGAGVEPVWEEGGTGEVVGEGVGTIAGWVAVDVAAADAAVAVDVAAAAVAVAVAVAAGCCCC